MKKEIKQDGHKVGTRTVWVDQFDARFVWVNGQACFINQYNEVEYIISKEKFIENYAPYGGLKKERALW